MYTRPRKHSPIEVVRWTGVLLLSIVLASGVAWAGPAPATPIDVAVAVAAAPMAEAPAAPRYLYLLSKPVPMDVQLGIIAKTLHYTYWAAEIGLKTAAFYGASGHAAPTVAFFMFTLGHSAPYLTAHTMIDVKIRQALRSSWMVRKLRDIPGIEKATILSSGALKFAGPLVSGRSSQNFIFVETSEPLTPDAEWSNTFGNPIDVTNSSATRISFQLMIDGRPSPLEWESSLIDVLDKKPIPTEIAEQWRAYVKEWDRVSKKARLDYMMGKHNRAVQINAFVTLPSGLVVPLDSMIAGGQVRKLLGMSFLQKVRDFFAERVGGRQLVERSVALDVKSFPLKQCARLLQEK